MITTRRAVSANTAHIGSRTAHTDGEQQSVALAVALTQVKAGNTFPAARRVEVSWQLRGKAVQSLGGIAGGQAGHYTA
eukprot:4147794-Prymnesium_polylepis.1